MKVSIITPSFNQSTYIETCIRTVLSQDYSDVEHIVIDGGSRDGTVEVLKKYEKCYDLKWVSEDDRGQSHALNKGFEKCAGDIVLWLNSDDFLVFRDALSKAVSVFNDSDCDFFYGNRVVVGADLKIKKIQYTNSASPADIANGYFPIFQENVFFKKSVVKNTKINEDLHIVMDTDLWIRLVSSYKYRYVDDIFCAFMVHGGNKTMDPVLIDRWNSEKHMLNRMYGVSRFEVGKGGQPLRYYHRVKSLFKGAYNKYIYVPRDYNRLTRKGGECSVELSGDGIFPVIKRSLTPFRG